ncbi:MAG TPA: CoA-binding protein [Thermodesulfovibrionales bacterium]|nr:CoA-binding protein [Thermodesulfovibrionales bacterium]
MGKEASINQIDLLFNPGSIALIGASHTEKKLSGAILKNLLRFRGKVYPVNPKYKKIMGLKAYSSLSELPEPVDLTIIIRPAHEILKILKEHERKAKCTIIVSSGFAEIGEYKLQDEIKSIARDTGIRILGPNCMGVYNPYHKLDTFFLSRERLKRLKKGNMAVVSQSGAILSCLFDALGTANIGISKAVNYGNAVDIDESDLYDYFIRDEYSDIVISYIESLSNGRKFVEKAKELSEKKAFLLLKSGKGSSGQAAAYSHTGRLAGRYEVFHSILRQFGIKEAMGFDDLVDTAKAISYQKTSMGNRVLIITNGGGSGVLASDECIRQGLVVAKLPKNKIEKLGKIFPKFYTISNPFDLTAQVKDEDYIASLNELKDDFDGFLIIALTGVLGVTERLGKMMKNLKAGIGKPIVFHIAHGGVSRKLTAILEKAGIPVYPSPERAVKVLKALLT